MAVDDSYTKLLLHCDGSDDGTSFIDEAGNTITRGGSVVTKTAVKKFGTASAYFDGNGDYLQPANSADYAVGKGKYTLDCWINFVSTAMYASIYESRTADGTDGFHLGCNANGANNKKLHLRSGGNNYIGSTVMTAGEWYHIAVVANGTGSTYRVYLNGALEINVGNTVTYNHTSELCIIGSYNGKDKYFWNGYIEEMRLSKGIARWTGNFTPPTEAYAPAAPPASGIILAQFI